MNAASEAAGTVGAMTAQGGTTPADPFTRMGDAELQQHIRAALDEQRRRAGEQGDFAALCETGFTEGFDSRGVARTPIVHMGLLICYGSVLGKSTMSHDCTFVHIDEHWVWEHPETLHDEVRKRPDRGREHQRSVSILPALEGLEFDLITCKMRNSVHQMQQVRSYRIFSGAIELVQTRNIKTDRYH